tara:strand:- start:25304 stop:26050 length:747 start_codon:yes stop_codon:yes gene_type:complete
MHWFLSLVLVGVGGLACGEISVVESDGGQVFDASNQADAAADASPDLETTITAIQSGGVPDMSEVVLTDVVVTGISISGRHFWIQDQGAAAAFNGIFVFRGMALLPADVRVGSTISLRGTYLEYLGGLSEILDVEFLSIANTPSSIAVLQGIDLETLASDDQYEGVVVELGGVRVFAGSDPKCESFCSFVLGSAEASLVATDGIFHHPDIVTGECYDVRGIMHRDPKHNLVIQPFETGMTLRPSVECP